VAVIITLRITRRVPPALKFLLNAAVSGNVGPGTKVSGLASCQGLATWPGRFNQVLDSCLLVFWYKRGQQTPCRAGLRISSSFHQVKRRRPGQKD
jgi:hypothetical protein